MTTSQFLKIKLTAHTPQFKDIIGLSESGNTSLLMDFCALMHPNQCKESQGNKCKVNTSKGYYIYSLYSNAILKTNVESGKKTIYKL